MKYAVHYGKYSGVVRQPAATVFYNTMRLSGNECFTIAGIKDEAPDVITGDAFDFICDWGEPGAIVLHEYSTLDEYAQFIAFGEEHPVCKYAVHAFEVYHYGTLPGSYRNFVVNTEDEEYAGARGFQAAREVIENFNGTGRVLYDEAMARTDTIAEAENLYLAMVARDSRVSVRKISSTAPDTIEGSFFDFCAKWEVR